MKENEKKNGPTVHKRITLVVTVKKTSHFSSRLHRPVRPLNVGLQVGAPPKGPRAVRAPKRPRVRMHRHVTPEVLHVAEDPVAEAAREPLLLGRERVVDHVAEEVAPEKEPTVARRARVPRLSHVEREDALGHVLAKRLVGGEVFAEEGRAQESGRTDRADVRAVFCPLVRVRMGLHKKRNFVSIATHC